MYDMLTLADLYQLHRDLARQHTGIHCRLVDPLTHQPLIDPMSTDWDLLSAKEQEIGETMRAVYLETARRERERRTDA